VRSGERENLCLTSQATDWVRLDLVPVLITVSPSLPASSVSSFFAAGLPALWAGGDEASDTDEWTFLDTFSSMESSSGPRERFSPVSRESAGMWRSGEADKLAAVDVGDVEESVANVALGSP